MKEYPLTIYVAPTWEQMQLDFDTEDHTCDDADYYEYIGQYLDDPWED